MNVSFDPDSWMPIRVEHEAITAVSDTATAFGNNTTQHRERVVRAACAYVAASNAFLARDAEHIDVLYWERDNKYRELEGAVDAFWRAQR